jgi:ABC-2 type transport system permease protein
MSLALQDVFSKDASVVIEVSLIDQANTEQSRELINELKNNKNFSFSEDGQLENKSSDKKQKAPLTLSLLGRPSILLAGNRPADEMRIVVDVEPDTQAYVVALFESVLREAQAKRYLSAMQKRMKAEGASPDQLAQVQAFASLPAPEIRYRYEGDRRQRQQKRPNSVQQNVPAWLVFAMFFVVVPLSNALLLEEKSGTLRRLKTYCVPPFYLLLGKFIPYFLINQLQAVSMFCVGVWLLPLLGTEALELGDHPGALFVLSMAVSVMALGYGLCIASLARTTEQATVFGGVGNILLAAIGGVMVPVFIMPDTMQQLASYSPMYWAVQGFLDVLLRGGGVQAIWPESVLLAGSGSILLLLAALFLNRKHLN